MANGYMPRKDIDARAWLINFAQQLGERAGDYKATRVEVNDVRDAVDRFVNALQVVLAPETRTSLAVLRKDQARLAAELTCRPIYLRVKVDPTISDDDKFILGVRPINPHRSRIAAPQTPPELQLAAMAFSGHVLTFSDFDSSRRAKPFGATQLQLFRRFADQPGEAMQLVGCFTRWPVRIEYDTSDNGRTAVYQARWMTRRGEVGPWSRELSAPVVAISPVLARRLAA